MRTIVTSLLLLAAAPVIVLAETGAPPPSAANLVRLHPGPWRLPVATHFAMRFDPETGEPAVVAGTPGTSAVALTSDEARARALAAASVTRHADGSLHAVLGAAYRQWEVVTIGPDGQLHGDCVSSAAAARALVEAGTRKQVQK